MTDVLLRKFLQYGFNIPVIVLVIFLGSMIFLQSTSKSDVCSAYREAWSDWDDSFAYIPNSVEDLADVAKRYEDGGAIEADGERLDKLLDATRLSESDFASATSNIASACGGRR